MVAIKKLLNSGFRGTHSSNFHQAQKALQKGIPKSVFLWEEFNYLSIAKLKLLIFIADWQFLSFFDIKNSSQCYCFNFELEKVVKQQKRKSHFQENRREVICLVFFLFVFFSSVNSNFQLYNKKS